MKIAKSREFKILIFLSLVAVCMRFWNVPDTLDLKFFYTASEAEGLLKAKTEAQIETYIIHQYFDTLYLIGYGLLFFSLMARVTTKRSLRWITLLPSLFDFVETWTVLGVLHESICVPEWLGLVTAIKWTLAYTLIALLIGLSWIKLKKAAR